jgi:hypothetical protein
MDKSLIGAPFGFSEKLIAKRGNSKYRTVYSVWLLAQSSSNRQTALEIGRTVQIANETTMYPPDGSVQLFERTLGASSQQQTAD